MFGQSKRKRPTAQEAAKRLLILKYVTVYGLTSPPRDMLKQWMSSWKEADRNEFQRKAEEMRTQTWGSLEKVGLAPAISPKERELSRTTMVSMTNRQQLDAIWRLESVQTIMWALQLIPHLPDFDTQADGEIMKKIPHEHVGAFIERARSRSDAEIDKARDYAEFWHWRARTRELIERHEPFNPPPQLKSQGIVTFDGLVRFVAKKASEEGRLRPFINGDFGAKGKAYRDLTAAEWSEVRSITMERHFALNWLCGYAPGNRWDDTPTDT